MNCEEARRHWDLYYDSEGGSELHLAINEHLEACPSCAKWFFQQGQFEDLLAARLQPPPATDVLWQRIHATCELKQPVVARSWLFLPAWMAIAAGLLIAVGAVFWGRWGDSPSHLAELTARWHERLANGDNAIEFASLSDLEVEDYLRRRVSFPVRCPPRKDAGFIVRGGGICTIAGEPAAYVVGQVDSEDVSIFILPAERLAEFEHERDALRRESVHHCREGAYDMVLAKIDRNLVVVIGQASPESLDRVVRSYGTYPEVQLDAAGRDHVRGWAAQFDVGIFCWNRSASRVAEASRRNGRYPRLASRTDLLSLSA